MKTSEAGIEAIMGREGFRTHGYLDTRGIPTNGVGHAATGGPPPVVVGEVWSVAFVKETLAHDLARFEAEVNASVKVELTQNEFDALVSLCFNIGTAGFQGSSVVRDLNDKHKAAAADAFLMWERPPELKIRRERERLQFLRP